MGKSQLGPIPTRHGSTRPTLKKKTQKKPKNILNVLTFLDYVIMLSRKALLNEKREISGILLFNCTLYFCRINVYLEKFIMFILADSLFTIVYCNTNGYILD
jgi:hypothetical protein